MSLTAQQPLNNVVRVAMQALAAVLGGTQSLHTNSFDEVLALPTEEAVTVALRTQQIIAEETGVAAHRRSARRLLLRRGAHRRDGSARPMAYIRKIDELGGIVRAIELGYPQQEIADAAYHYQLHATTAASKIGGRRQQVRDGRRAAGRVPAHRRRGRAGADRAGGRVKASRDAAQVEKRLKQLAEACRERRNVMPVLVDAVKDYVSLGEIADVYRRVFGLYREPIIF